MTAFNPQIPAEREGQGSKDPRQGRRLVLKFVTAKDLELDRIEFHYQKDAPPYYLQQGGGDQGFSFSRTYQALAVLIVETCAAFASDQSKLYFLCGERKGSLAASLGNAIYADEHRLNTIFAEPAIRGTLSRFDKVFGGKNVHGKDDGERRICVQPDWLPLENIQVYWDARGSKPLDRPGEFRALADRLWALSGEMPKVTPLVEIPDEPNQSPKSPPADPAGPEKSAPSLPNLPELLENHDFIVGALKDHGSPEEITLWLKQKGVSTTEARVRTFCQAILPSLPTVKPVDSATRPPGEPEKKERPVGDAQVASSLLEQALGLFIKRQLKEPVPVFPEPEHALPVQAKPAPSAKPSSHNSASIPAKEPLEQTTTPTNDSSEPAPTKSQGRIIPPIRPQYFQIYTEGHTWDDDAPLIAFGEGEEPWRIKDAFEGLLILGAPGSGKTSGSGNTFAREFLRAGFGGLVLCAKPGEAQRWETLCEQSGRGNYMFIVNGESPFKLNFLAYESQRPGGEFGLAENLVKLFRVLIETISTDENPRTQDAIWINATNQLMRSMFEAFILARESLTIDGLNRFLSQAPKARLNDPANDWRGIPIFGDILTRASRADGPGEPRVFVHILEYWTREYPSYSDKTRSSFTLGFSAMADVLSGRGIHELACDITTLTPEIILSGGIVILDLPIKTYGQGGLLIQAAWKHLFQRAIERRTRADNDAHRYLMYPWTDDLSAASAVVQPGTGDRRCPVFLWEDEGQFFFSKHDIDFQATCREARAAHVVISQNLHNFYQRGYGRHAVEGVFALMNTQVFHCNGDEVTNRWAAEKIGKELKLRFNFSTSRSDQTKPDQFFESTTRSKTFGSSSSKNWELLVRPEEFSALMKGGKGTSEAIVLWMSHQFQNNDGKPYAKIIFNQG
jgi:hypothetical protein